MPEPATSVRAVRRLLPGSEQCSKGADARRGLISRRRGLLICIHSRSIDGFQVVVPDLNMPAAMSALSFKYSR